MPLVRTAASKAGSDAAAAANAERGRKAVGVWLLGCSGMVFVAVVLGAGMLGYAALVLAVCYVMDVVVQQTGAGRK